MMRSNIILKLFIAVFLLSAVMCYAENGYNSELEEYYKLKQEQSIDLKQLESDADTLFYAGIDSDDLNSKEAYLSSALVKYMLLLKIKPDDVVTCTQIAVIHDNLNHSSIAKEYFFRALNLDNLNPFTNYYCAEYYFGQKDYAKALKYYTAAYNNGYKDYFPVNLKLATVYEKLGDIQQARKFYIAAKSQNPSQKGLAEKINSLGKVYYSKSDYSRK